MLSQMVQTGEQLQAQVTHKRLHTLVNSFDMVDEISSVNKLLRTVVARKDFFTRSKIVFVHVLFRFELRRWIEDVCVR